MSLPAVHTIDKLEGNKVSMVVAAKSLPASVEAKRHTEKSAFGYGLPPKFFLPHEVGECSALYNLRGLLLHLA
jgi:hypothetical protein